MSVTMQEIEERLGKFRSYDQLNDKEREAIARGTRLMSFYGTTGSVIGSAAAFYLTRGRTLPLRIWTATFVGTAGFVLGTATGAYRSTRKLVRLDGSPLALEMRKIIHEQRQKGNKIPWVFRDVELSTSDKIRLEEQQFEPEVLDTTSTSEKAGAWSSIRLGDASMQMGSDTSETAAERKKSAWDRIREQARKTSTDPHQEFFTEGTTVFDPSTEDDARPAGRRSTAVKSAEINVKRNKYGDVVADDS